MAVDVEVSWAAIIKKIMWLTMSASENRLPSSSSVWHNTVSRSLPDASRRSLTRAVK
ncbi:Uncharacterised protein [Mycobacterium tuberculosis]|uniref:Uncharacterized protein n=1 Tax=Mycobacterium tuberculosis TaxID=1773 RepID=A0A654ZCP0_MYCTX|nr:Uncharacterised protein [Mycobacterium tuberculosis]CFS35461.1 Uncharacterised protein [Mycobacterium tuberculosis]CKO15374.1 Uncharacterised protein [Mycobacterium tuberculosis]CNV65181.1 Uncharacterised protein [Mycobacterium tuberculosis]CNV98711.1 Uncharacterised protein [Mycobacterium tuberculosis]